MSLQPSVYRVPFTVYRYTVRGSRYTRVDGIIRCPVLGRRTDERLSFTDGIVLAQRVPLELLVHEDAARVRVAGEADAEHVPDFPLEPVRRRPERGQGIDDQVCRRHPHPQAGSVGGGPGGGKGNDTRKG